jgi:hypothetical protein
LAARLGGNSARGVVADDSTAFEGQTSGVAAFES